MPAFGEHLSLYFLDHALPLIQDGFEEIVATEIDLMGDNRK